MHVFIYRDGDWLYAKLLKDGGTGYVPRSYVAEEKSLESYE